MKLLQQKSSRILKISSAHSKSVSMMNFEERFRDSIDPAQINLMLDLDDGFFADSYQLVQSLSDRSPFLAAKFKLYVDILSRLHGHYCNEVDQGKALQLKVKTADEKLKLALKTTATSEAMMESLRESLEESWRNEDATKSRGEAMQMQLMSLVQTDQPTSNRTVNDAPITNAKEAHIQRLVFRERDRLAAELKDYQKRLQTNRLYSESLEGMLDVSKEMISKLNSRVKQIESENFRLEHKLNVDQDKYEDRLLHLNKELAHVVQQNQELQVVDNTLAELVTSNDALKLRNDRLQRDNYNYAKSLRLLEDDKQKLSINLKAAEGFKDAQRRNIADLDLSRRAAERDAKKKADESLIMERRFHQLSKKNAELNDQALVNQNEIKVQEKTIMVATAKLDEAIRQKDEIGRSRDKLRVEISRLNDTVAGVRHEIATIRHQMQDLQNDLHRANKQLDDKDVQVQKIAREKKELSVELNDAYKKIDGIEEILALKSERLEALQVEVQQKQVDFANVKKQMEIIHSEKVMLMKTMDMCSRDRSVLQNNATKLTHQLNQMTSALSINEKEISTLGNQIEQLNRTVKQKQNEIHSKGRLLTSTRSDLREMKIRVEQAQHTIDTDEKRFKSMACALEEVTKEKSLVGLQMVRRNDEVRLLREKLEMMQKAIDRGTMQYNQRIEDIRLLKLEVVNLRSSHECMQREVGNKAAMRHDVVRLERQLNRERLRVTAYSEELARPCRIHRWRVLLGKDPRRFELIRKNQHLLKRNIRISVERDNKAKELADFMRVHEEFKRQIKHLPDPSVLQKLCAQQRINRRQTRQIKAMKAELRINDIDLKARERLIEGFQEQLRLHHQKNPESAICMEDFKVPTAKTMDNKYVDHVFDFTSTCEDKPESNEGFRLHIKGSRSTIGGVSFTL
ncbi:cilia- and flagella-associated protein 58 [Drosophila subpulchrella]|uniref:cilia- and flagella-associated protein 58 n=1 Tax=Drosophila subpulchrella TaxID=1486046 RepID=UPI0018A19ED1|nr:cilia- and flagella-associated protein 58 [Drosophila subpulchrella]